MKRASDQGLQPLGLLFILGASVCAAVLAAGPRPAAAEQEGSLYIGWAQTDITPDRPAVIGGMPWARIATEAMDPLTATVLVLESRPADRAHEHVILVSCDLRGIRADLRDGVRAAVAQALPAIDPLRIILNATHTHNAPPLGSFGIELEGMEEAEYQAFAAPRIAEAVRQAWESRQPGGISFGLTYAVVGRNRLQTSINGRSRMYGNTNRPDFSHIEGYEDPSVNLLYTWNRERELTGVVINLAAPSQVSRGDTRWSADFWHDTREALRGELGSGLYVLPQCSAAGDQDTNVLWDRQADARMLEITGRNRRQEIAARLTAAVCALAPLMEEHIEWQPVLRHHIETLPLPRRMLTEADVAAAREEARPHRERYEQMRTELEADPTLRANVAWLRGITQSFWRARRGQHVEERFELQHTDPLFPVEVHAVRLGDMAIVMNPFELYLDYGIQIKARSPAVQTFVVQLAGGGGGYAPTERSIAGGAYGAVPASTQIGPEGARQLVTWTVETLQRMMTTEEIDGQE